MADDRDDGIDRAAMRRRFEMIKTDRDQLLAHIGERAAAFSADPAEQRDYRRTLIYLLVAQAVGPLYDKEDRSQVDILLARLRKAFEDRSAQRKEIHRLLTDLGLAVDDAFEV
jgi:hypothetical protein